MTSKTKKTVRRVKSSRIGSIEAIMGQSPAKKRYHVPFDIPIRCHRKASLGADQEKSVIKETDLRKLRDKYFISNDSRINV